MDAQNHEVIRMIDKMTAAGWIASSGSREEGGMVQWSDKGKTAMLLLHVLMFHKLDLKPGEESVLAWMVFDFPDAQRRVGEEAES
jgi:hypothetical protein